MNIAFSALVAFVLALPGIVFWRAFKTTKNGSYLVRRSLSEEMALGLPTAAVLHAVWACIFQFSGPAYLAGVRVDLPSALMLLMSKYGKDDASLAHAVDSITQHPHWVLVYFVSLGIGAYVLGRTLQTLVRERRIDRRLPLLALNPWWYLLRLEDLDDDLDGVLVYALCDLQGTECEFHGLLYDFFLTEDGNLDTIVLAAASASRIDDGRRLASLSDVDGYRVLRYSDVKSLRVRVARLLLRTE